MSFAAWQAISLQSSFMGAMKCGSQPAVNDVEGDHQDSMINTFLVVTVL